MSAHFTTPTDEMLLLAETLGEVKTKTEKLEAEFSTQARPLEAATNALSAALSGIKALQFHVLDNNLGQLSARVEEMRKAVDEQVGVIALELKKADETNAAKAGQDAEALRSEIAALQAQLGTLGAQFAAQLERVEFSAKEEAKKLQLIPGPAGAAGASLNPRGTFIDGETYNRLDVVSWLGSSYIAAIDGVTEKPSKNSNQWQVLASRGGGAAGGAADFGSLAGVAQINQGGTGQTTRAAGLNALLPDQAGATQYMLLTDGAGNVSWGAQPVAGLPSQTSNSGRLLTTNGTTASWSSLLTVDGTGSVTVNSTSSGALKIDNPTNPNLYFYSNGSLKTQINYVASSSSFVVDHADQSEIKLNVFGGGTTTVGGRLLVSSTTASTTTSSGALVVSGGVGVGGDVNIGGTLGVNGATTLGSFSGDANVVIAAQSTGVGYLRWRPTASATNAYGFSIGYDNTNNKLSFLRHDFSTAGVEWLSVGRTTGNATFAATTASTSTSSGALVVSGGVGVAGNTNIGGVASVGGSSNSAVGIYVINTALTGVDQYGVASEPIWTSAATSGHTIWARTKTAASAFTLTHGQAFFVEQPTLGSGSSITNIYGMRIRNQGAAGVTNAYGLYVESQSGAATVNYAIYTAGGRINFQGLPTSSAGLPAGTLWNDGGTLKIA